MDVVTDTPIFVNTTKAGSIVIAGVSAPVTDNRRPKRLPLSEHLPRYDIVHAAPGGDDCTACGGTMAKLGASVTEVLDYVPGRFHVLRHILPKLAYQAAAVLAQINPEHSDRCLRHRSSPSYPGARGAPE